MGGMCIARPLAYSYDVVFIIAGNRSCQLWIFS